jgi:hypothetical protein
MALGTIGSGGHVLVESDRRGIAVSKTVPALVAGHAEVISDWLAVCCGKRCAGLMADTAVVHVGREFYFELRTTYLKFSGRHIARLMDAVNQFREWTVGGIRGAGIC